MSSIKYVIHDEVQGTPEWSALRLKKRTASEASAMLGKSPYMTRDELILLKATGETKPVSSFLQKIFDDGHKSEALARPVMQKILNNEFFPMVLSRVIDGIETLSSYDGIDILDVDGWEHKIFSIKRNKFMSKGVIPPHDVYQLEQQLMTADLKRIHFTISNLLPKLEADKKQPVTVIYESDPVIRAELIAGWKQFNIDLEAYKKGEYKLTGGKKDVAVITPMPKLSFEVTGKVKKASVTGIIKYSTSASEYLAAVNVNLESDDDFAQAELDYKFCEKVRAELKTAIDKGMEEAVEIKKYEKILSDLADDFHTMEKSLKALVKTKKQDIKDAINYAAAVKFDTAVVEANNKLSYRIIAIAPDFNAAMKSKRTVDALKTAVNDALNNALGDIKSAEVIVKNNTIALENAKEHSFLFPDAKDFINNSFSDVELLISSRILKHKEDQKLKEPVPAVVPDDVPAAHITASAVYPGASINREAPSNTGSGNADPYAGEPDPTEMSDQYPQVNGQAAENVMPIEVVKSETGPTEQQLRDVKNAAYKTLVFMGFDNKEAIRFISAVADGLVDGIKLDIENV